MAEFKPENPDFKFEITFQYKTIPSQTFESNIETIRCQLHEYAYLSYIRNNSDVLKCFNVYIEAKEKAFFLSKDGDRLCIWLQPAVRTTETVHNALKDFKDCVNNFGQRHLVFDILSSQQVKPIQQLVASIPIYYQQVEIGGKQRIAIVYEKAENDKFMTAMQTSENELNTIQHSKKSTSIRGTDGSLAKTEMSQSAPGTKSMSEASSVSSRAINADSSEMPVKQKDTPAQASCISMTEINGTRSKMSGSQKNGQQSLIPSVTKKSSFEESVPIDELQYKLLQHFYGPECHKLHYIDGYAVISAGNSTLLDKAKQGFTKKLNHVKKLQSSIYTPTKVSTSPEDGAQLCQKYCNDKTFCYYDKGAYHIYGILYEDVTSAKHQLEIDLGDLHVQREKDRCFQNAADLRSRKPSDSKETKPQVQFSWKSDAENLKVFEVNKMYVRVYVGDILNVPVEAIVNAANADLKHGGGIARLISRAAGRKLDEECYNYIRVKRLLSTAEVYTSSAGNLPYKYVIHAVGPEWKKYEPHTTESIKRCERDLEATIHGCLLEADKKQLMSVAFPAVSSAIFGCPVDLCAVQYARAIMAYKPYGHLKEIHFVDKKKQVVELVQKALECLQMKKDPDFYNRNAYLTKQSSTASKGRPLGKDSKPNDSTPRTGNQSVALYPYCNRAGSELYCNLGMKHHLYIIQGNIFDHQHKCDMFVCSDDVTGKQGGFLSQHLAKHPKYKLEKETTFRKVKTGDIVVCKGLDTGYRYIAHAIFKMKKDFKTEPERRKGIEEMFMKIFNSMKTMKCGSLVLPVLGTGKGNADPYVYAECLLLSLKNFSQQNSDYTFVVRLLNKDQEVNQIAATIAESMFSKSGIGNRKTANSKQTSSTYGERSFDSRSDSDCVKAKSMCHYDCVKAKSMCHYDKGHYDSLCKDSSFDETKCQGPDSTKRTSITSPINETENAPRSLGVHDDRDKKQQSDHEDCVICMDAVRHPHTLDCGHTFCTACIDEQFKRKPVCPACGRICGELTEETDCVSGAKAIHPNTDYVHYRMSSVDHLMDPFSGR